MGRFSMEFKLLPFEREEAFERVLLLMSREAGVNEERREEIVKESACRRITATYTCMLLVKRMERKEERERGGEGERRRGREEERERGGEGERRRGREEKWKRDKEGHKKQRNFGEREGRGVEGRGVEGRGWKGEGWKGGGWKGGGWKGGGWKGGGGR